jgi:hypothetical protein
MATGAAWLKAGTHRGMRRTKTYSQEGRRKTYLTLAGQLMEGLDPV